MATRGTHRLYWDPERSEALWPIAGSVQAMVAPGGMYEVLVDHSGDPSDETAVYATNWPPTVEAVEGIVFLPCADETDGMRFKLLAMVSDEWGTVYGYPNPATISISWTRTGVLSAPPE